MGSYSYREDFIPPELTFLLIALQLLGGLSVKQETWHGIT
jgi:hypothetical protein